MNNKKIVVIEPPAWDPSIRRPTRPMRPVTAPRQASPQVALPKPTQIRQIVAEKWRELTGKDGGTRLKRMAHGNHGPIQPTVKGKTTAGLPTKNLVVRCPRLAPPQLAQPSQPPQLMTPPLALVSANHPPSRPERVAPLRVRHMPILGITPDPKLARRDEMGRCLFRPKSTAPGPADPPTLPKALIKILSDVIIRPADSPSTSTTAAVNRTESPTPGALHEATPTANRRHRKLRENVRLPGGRKYWRPRTPPN